MVVFEKDRGQLKFEPNGAGDFRQPGSQVQVDALHEALDQKKIKLTPGREKEELEFLAAHLNNNPASGLPLEQVLKSAVLSQAINKLKGLKFDTDSTRSNKIFDKIKNVTNSSGDDGFKFARSILGRRFDGIEGFDEVIKKVSIDFQSLKSVNQALDKAEELLKRGIPKSNLRFEHSLGKYHDIDLGIKHSTIPNKYVEAYQFKDVEGQMNAGKIRKAADQLSGVDYNKRILEFDCNPLITVSDINSDSVIREMKFQAKLIKPNEGAGIHEFHFKLSDGNTIIKTLNDLL